RHTLFSIWLCKLHSQNDYVAHVRGQLQLAGALTSTFNKFLYLDGDLLSQMTLSGFTILSEALISHYFEIGRSLKSSVPVTLVLDLNLEASRPYKMALLQKRIAVNDGHEHIEFQPWAFNNPPVINVGRGGAFRTNDKIDRASYVIRILTRPTYEM